MRKNKIVVFLSLCCFILLMTSSAIAQKKSRKNLEQKKAQLKKEISYTKRLLGSTKKNKRASLGQLMTINKQISSRKELIITINKEITYINYKIQKNKNDIKEQQNELDKLKAEYAQMIYYAYKNQNSYNRLMFIFAAEDFDQAFMRLRYLQQYSEYRHKQAEMIVITKDALAEKAIRLVSQKEQKRSLLSSEEEEKLELVSEKKQKEKVVSKLQQKENELKKELKKKKRDALKFQRAIERVIQQELEKARKEAEKNNEERPVKIGLTPEALKLSATFASNKGKLPWPVEKGFVIERFGVHPHPVMKNININNNGIDIKTNQGAVTRAVFNGEVKAIVNMPGSGKFILVRHGEYLTIYSNLVETYVKVGDKVISKQKIGAILYNEKDDGTILHFELWKGQIKQNPESWIYKNH